MTKKITATYAGQTFTRRTDRTYTHLIIGKANREQDIASGIRNASWQVKNDWPFYVREAGDNPQFADQHSEKQLAEFRRIVAMGQDAWLAELIERVHARAAQNDYDSYIALNWCGRPDLAARQVETAQRKGFLDVRAIEVQQ